VFFAVLFALVMRSFQLGAFDRLFRNVIESYTGYMQLQHKDYIDDPVLDNGFVLDRGLAAGIQTDPNVTSVLPRLESFALVAAGSRTQGVIVMGIDPEGEDRFSGIRRSLVRFKLSSTSVEALRKEAIPDRTKKLLGVFTGESYASQGRLMLDLGITEKDSASILPAIRSHASVTNGYLADSDTCAVVIGSGLSEYLKAGIGDTLVLMGQGYHGTAAAGKYTVKGIVKLPAPDIDNRIVYLSVKAAQDLYAAPGITTSAVLSLKNNDDKSIGKTSSGLAGKIPEPLVLVPWRKLNELLVNQMEADNRSGMIMIGILYLVIAFGVFGTVLMMMAERRREFGMLVSIGMQKRKLAKVVSFEMLFIGILGVATGVIASLPPVFYLHFHPIRFTGQLAHMYEDYGFDPVMPSMLPDKFYLWQVVVVMIIIAIAILFSMRKIFRINVIKSMRT
jgi:ABC-type lipoprotein release transport system permease subunit